MVGNNRLQQKLQGAFKGVIRTHELAPTNTARTQTEERDHIIWRGFIEDNGRQSDLLLARREYDRFLDLVEQRYPGQTDAQRVSRDLADATKEWIEAGYSLSDQRRVEQAEQQLLDRIAHRIMPLTVYILVEGVEITNNGSLPLARCQLWRNHPNSELIQIVRRSSVKDPESVTEAEKAPAYLTVDLHSDSGRATRRALEEAALALSVFRLFKASFYCDRYRQRIPRQLGILGTLQVGAFAKMYVIRKNDAIEAQFPGMSESYIPLRAFDLTDADITRMKNLGLARINEYFHQLATDTASETARSMLRAITWFGKATTADSIAESFLMYAISAEGLLSGGDRALKEMYANRITALVTRQDDAVFPYPSGGYLSKRFVGELNSGANRDQRLDSIQGRVVDLFNERNHIAHGIKIENEIEASDLIDIETLVRNAILSYADGGWNSLDEFKKWMTKNMPSRFLVPPGRSWQSCLSRILGSSRKHRLLR